MTFRFMALAAAFVAGCSMFDKPVAPLALPEGQPLVQVNVPAVSAQATFSRVAVSRGIETYSATTPVTISLDRGLLVATRGLGADLMAADISATRNAFSGGAGEYRRKYRLLDGENHSDYLYAACAMHPKGRERVGAVSLSRFEEVCHGRAGNFTNIYWLDSAGFARASLQWAGPSLGQVTMLFAAKAP